MNEISKRDARRLFLHSQGLLRNAQFGRGKQATLRAIEQLGHVQIDTISVVDRAHHHILKTRVPNYSERMLHRLQWEDRKIFEYWAHAAAYLPMSEYRYYLPMMEGFRQRPLGAILSEDTGISAARLVNEILARISSEGPLQSRDFENPKGRNSTGWWDWKPAKRVLETLFLRGDLMITRRDGFQKVYDLAENVLPSEIDTSTPSHDQWCRFIALRMTRSLGAATAMDIGYARTTIRRFTGVAVQNDIGRALNELSEEGTLVRLESGKETLYSIPALLELLPIKLGRRQLFFLSPFDNLVINRKRAVSLFDFDYQIECYVPEAKRRYGYYCLPILWGDQLVGRLDARAERSAGRLDVRLLQLESHVKFEEPLKDALGEGLGRLAIANGCDHVEIARTEPRKLRREISLPVQ